MKRMTALVAAALALTGLVSLNAQAQMPGIGRADLLKETISVAGKELVQVRVDFGPGASAPRHSHPGEEVAFVLEGTLEYRIDGRPPVTLKAGETLFIPAGAVHSAHNVHGGNAKELATYIVARDQPLVTLAK